MMKSLFILIFLWSCSGQSQDTIKEAKDLIAYCDGLFESNSNQILTYALIDKNQPPIKVNNLEEWTSREYVSFINVIKKEGSIIAYIVSPYSESGDWYNVYSYYYGSDGKLIAFRSFSSFYNSICVNDQLTEVSLSFYQNGEVISRTNQVKDDDGNILKDTSNCVFNYRFEVPVYKKLEDIPYYKTFK